MDGPYVIRISAAGAQTSELAFCRETDTTEVLMKSRLNKLMLRETLVAAAEEVLSVCKRANMASADIDSLANELTKLRG